MWVLHTAWIGARRYQLGAAANFDDIRKFSDCRQII